MESAGAHIRKLILRKFTPGTLYSAVDRVNQRTGDEFKNTMAQLLEELECQISVRMQIEIHQEDQKRVVVLPAVMKWRLVDGSEFRW